MLGIKKYLLTLFAIVSIFLVTIASFNYIISGKRGLRTEFLFGGDAGYIKNKIIAAQAKNPKVLYVHSSRGMSFELDTGLKEYFKDSFSSLPLPGVDIKNLVSCAEQIADVSSVETIVIGLDFYAFNKNWKVPINDVCSKQALNIQLAKRLIYLQVTLENISWLLGTTFPQKTMLGQKTFADAGIELLDKSRLELADFYKSKGIKEVVQRYRVNQEYYFPKYTWFPGANREYTFGFPNKTVEQIRDLLEYAKHKNIKVYGFISPIHARLLESLIASGLEPKYEQWQRDLIEVFSKYDNSVLWDFSIYNSITTEPRPKIDSPNLTMKYYNDMSHHTTETGQLVMYKIFNIENKNLPRDFGVVLNKDNFEEQKTKFKMAQKQYRDMYPEEYQEVIDVVKYAKAVPKWEF